MVYTVILFVILSLLYSMVEIILQVNTNQIKKNEIIKNEERLVSVERDALSDKIHSLLSDLLYISDSFNEYNLESNSLKKIEYQLRGFSDRKKIYDQIRFIDVNGNEKIRINYFENGSIVVDESKLQNKKERYYFKDTISFKKDQIYISKLDLNIENDKIETPIKPMIRLSTPVFDKNSKLMGVVVLNYYAKYLLQDFENIASTSLGNLFLLDSNGYWIYNDIDKTKEWSFMYQDKKNLSFKNEFPNEWDTIKKNEKGTFVTQNGYFTYTNIMPIMSELANNNHFSSDAIILGEGNWLAVSYLSFNSKYEDIIFGTFYQNVRYILKSRIYIFVLIIIASLIFGILMAINKNSKDKIKYFSEYDAMTGVYNRRAGYEILEKSYQEITKNAGRICVCFIDINGLKEVNDNLGHEVGDELIVSIVNEIKKYISQSDYVIRLGGDEFLIVFIDANEAQAEAVWNRINDEYTKINETENRKYIISASHGIAEFKFNSNEYIENIINLADEKMYIEKKAIKRGLKTVTKTHPN